MSVQRHAEQAPPGTKDSSPSPMVDRFGAVASGLCAVHCASVAIIPGALAAMGLGALLSHEAEWAFTLVAVALALVALVLLWRQHRSMKIAALFGVGIVGLLGSRFLEEAGVHGVGTAAGVVGGLLVFAAHIANLRAAKRRRAEGCD